MEHLQQTTAHNRLDTVLETDSHLLKNQVEFDYPVHHGNKEQPTTSQKTNTEKQHHLADATEEGSNLATN